MKVSKASVINVLGFSSLNPRPTFLQSYSSASFGDPPCTSLRGVEGQLAKAWVPCVTLRDTRDARASRVLNPEARRSGELLCIQAGTPVQMLP